MDGVVATHGISTSSHAMLQGILLKDQGKDSDAERMFIQVPSGMQEVLCEIRVDCSLFQCLVFSPSPYQVR